MKPPTLAAASKRVIRDEIKTLRRAHTKLTRDHVAEQKRLLTEQRKLSRQKLQIEKRVERNSAAIIRRLSILHGRL